MLSLKMELQAPRAGKMRADCLDWEEKLPTVTVCASGLLPGRELVVFSADMQKLLQTSAICAGQPAGLYSSAGQRVKGSRERSVQPHRHMHCTCNRIGCTQASGTAQDIPKAA